MKRLGITQLKGIGNHTWLVRREREPLAFFDLGSFEADSCTCGDRGCQMGSAIGPRAEDAARSYKRPMEPDMVTSQHEVEIEQKYTTSTRRFAPWVDGLIQLPGAQVPSLLF